jgi:hypothetical protein
MPQRFGIQISEHLSLKTIGDYRKQQMAGQVAWRFSPEHRSPSRPQRFDIETAQARDLVFQRYFGCLRATDLARRIALPRMARISRHNS